MILDYEQPSIIIGSRLDCDFIKSAIQRQITVALYLKSKQLLILAFE